MFSLISLIYYSNFFLQFLLCKNVIIPSEVREIIRSPLFGVCHLNFKMHDHKSFPLSDIVDGLMWILPHVESISIEYEDAYWDKPYIEVSLIFHFKEVKTIYLYHEDVMKYFDLLVTLLLYIRHWVFFIGRSFNCLKSNYNSLLWWIIKYYF